MGTGRGILVGVVSRCAKPQQTRFDQEAKAFCPTAALCSSAPLCRKSPSVAMLLSSSIPSFVVVCQSVPSGIVWRARRVNTRGPLGSNVAVERFPCQHYDNSRSVQNFSLKQLEDPRQGCGRLEKRASQNAVAGADGTKNKMT